MLINNQNSLVQESCYVKNVSIIQYDRMIHTMAHSWMCNIHRQNLIDRASCKTPEMSEFLGESGQK